MPCPCSIHPAVGHAEPRRSLPVCGCQLQTLSKMSLRVLPVGAQTETAAMPCKTVRMPRAPEKEQV